MERLRETDSNEVLDPRALASLAELVGGEPELVEIVDAFLEEGPDRIAELRGGVECGDAELTARASHTLKSNALTFGAGELAELSRRVEELAGSGDLMGARALVPSVESAWERTRSSLTALRGQRIGRCGP